MISRNFPAEPTAPDRMATFCCDAWQLFVAIVNVPVISQKRLSAVVGPAEA
jgi:hypothetical protein